MRLTPNEFSVIVHLLGVEEYRLYRNEVKDGWFVKSQTELAKECGIKSSYTFRNVINSLIDKGMLNIDRVNGLTTKFKITLSKNDMDTLSNNNRDTLSKIDTLHNTNIIRPENKTSGPNLDQLNNIEELNNIGPINNLDNINNNIIKEKEDNTQPSVRLSTENSTIEELVEDYLNNHNGKLDSRKDSRVNGFILNNKEELNKMRNIYGYLSKENYKVMFEYLKENNK